MGDISQRWKGDTKPKTNYDKDIDESEKSRHNQKNDTNPMRQKDGCMFMDDIDRLRRRKIEKLF